MKLINRCCCCCYCCCMIYLLVCIWQGCINKTVAYIFRSCIDRWSLMFQGVFICILRNEAAAWQGNLKQALMCMCCLIGYKKPWLDDVLSQGMLSNCLVINFYLDIYHTLPKLKLPRIVPNRCKFPSLQVMHTFLFHYISIGFHLVYTSAHFFYLGIIDD